VKYLAINFAAKMNKKRKLAKFLIHLAVFLQNEDLFILKYYSIALPKIHNHNNFISSPINFSRTKLI
jgi:hypothetical protein